MRSARRSYFGDIKKAKFSHWAEYLSSLSPSLVWEAKKLACGQQQPRFPSFPDKDTPEGIKSALLYHFFPAPPPPSLADVTGNLSPYIDYFPVRQEEFAAALAKSSSSAAPGPDTISYGPGKRSTSHALPFSRTLSAPYSSMVTIPLPSKRPTWWS